MTGRSIPTSITCYIIPREMCREMMLGSLHVIDRCLWHGTSTYLSVFEAVQDQGVGGVITYCQTLDEIMHQYIEESGAEYSTLWGTRFKGSGVILCSSKQNFRASVKQAAPYPPEELLADSMEHQLFKCDVSVCDK